MDYRRFYQQLFEPLQTQFGTPDPDTICGIIGFEAGGPVSLTSFSAGKGAVCSYATCELAVRADQHESEDGPFELIVSTQSESCARRLLTLLGAMSLDVALGHHHSVDLAAIEDQTDLPAGVVLERVAQVVVSSRRYAILHCIGVTRSELEIAQQSGVQKTLELLRARGIYPITDPTRQDGS